MKSFNRPSDLLNCLCLGEDTDAYCPIHGAHVAVESHVEFNLRYGHSPGCCFGTMNSGMCNCGKGFGEQADGQ